MSKIENEWAWSQVEALADGSLAAPEAARMERAMAEDPALAAAVATARDVLRTLERRRPPRPPAGLLRSLLAARPAASRARRFAGLQSPSFGVTFAGVAATAALVWMIGSMAVRIPDPEQQKALREFAVAMAYLRETAVTTRDEVGRQVGQGLVTAIEIGSQSLAEKDTAGESNGG